MSTTKEFHISDILSVTTGKLLSKDGMDGLYDIMDFLTGNNGISTIGLITFKDHATDTLLSQFPELKNVHVPDSVNSFETTCAFLAEMEEKFGAMRTIEYEDASHKSVGIESDMETIHRLNPNAKIIPIVVED